MYKTLSAILLALLLCAACAIAFAAPVETSLRKAVLEDSTGCYGAENSAQAGDTVSYRCGITIGEGCTNLVLHTDLKHLSHYCLQPESIRVMVGAKTVNPKHYTLSYEHEDPEDPARTIYLADGCTFEIAFDNAFVEALPVGTVLRVSYDESFRPSKMKMYVRDVSFVSFGDGIKSPEQTVTTHTCALDLLKVDKERNIIGTAQFRLYDTPTGGSPIPLWGDDTPRRGYYFHVDDGSFGEPQGAGDPIRADAAQIYGLDRDVYWLEEIVPPDGYARRTERIRVDLTHGSLLLCNDDDEDVAWKLTSGNMYTRIGEGYADFDEAEGSCIGLNVQGRGGFQLVNSNDPTPTPKPSPTPTPIPTPTPVIPQTGDDTPVAALAALLLLSLAVGGTMLLAARRGGR